MLHSLRDIKKINLKKYGDVGETLLRQNFFIFLIVEQNDSGFMDAGSVWGGE
jgi:hypothetical protein